MQADTNTFDILSAIDLELNKRGRKYGVGEESDMEVRGEARLAHRSHMTFNCALRELLVSSVKCCQSAASRTQRGYILDSLRRMRT